MQPILTLLQARTNLSNGNIPVFGSEWSDDQKNLRINEVIERWYNEGTWVDNVRRVTTADGTLSVADGLMTLETEYFALSRLSIPDEQYPIDIKPKEFEHKSPDSTGPRDWTQSHSIFAIDRGFFGGKRQYLLTGDPVVLDVKEYEGLARRRFKFLANDLEEINPPNFGALKQGCMSLEYEVRGNFEMANAAWSNCLRLLNEQLHENIQDAPSVISIPQPNNVNFH